MPSSSLHGALGPDQSAPQRWYYSGPSELRQLPYTAQTLYQKEPNIYFHAPNGGPILLKDIFAGNFCLFNANSPWTESDTIGQKIGIRLILSDVHFVKHVNVRRENKAREPIDMKKLAKEVARSVYEPLRAYCDRTGLHFECLILAGLEHIAQGSWKPIIYVKNGP